MSARPALPSAEEIGNLVPIGRIAKDTPYSADILRQLARSGKLRAYKLNRDWLTTQDAVRDYLKSQTKRHEKALCALQAAEKAFLALTLMLIVFFATPQARAQGFSNPPPRAASSMLHKLTAGWQQFLLSFGHALLGKTTEEYLAEAPARRLMLVKHSIRPLGTPTEPSISSAGEAPQVLGSSTSESGSTPESNQSISTAQIQTLIDQTLQSYLAFGKLTGPVGPPGASDVTVGFSGPNGMVHNSNGQTTSIIGGTPIVSYVPASNNGNYSGGSLAGFTTLSANTLSAGTANFAGNLTVQGGAAFGSGTFSRSLSAGPSTLSALTVSGPATLNGSTTIAGLTVTGFDPGLTLGSVAFQGGSGLSQDNANFFYDSTNHRLGIGTATPAQLLAVAGNMRLSGALFDANNASGTIGMLLQTTGTGTRWVATSTLGISVGGANFWSQNGNSLYNNTGYQVGINSSTPLATLSVVGSSTDPTLPLFTVASSSGSQYLTVTAAGNVGIGATGPQARLDVAGTVRASDTIISSLVNGSTNVLWLQHDPTVNGTVGTASGNVGGFKFGADYQSNRWTNGPVGQTNYIDDVWRLGSNVGTLDGHRASTTLANLHLTLESKYYQSNKFAHEFHLEGGTADGLTTYRPLSFFVAHDGSLIGGNITADYLNVASKDGTQRVKLDFESGNNIVNIPTNTAFLFGVNSTPIMKQQNAANDAFLNLPYIDAGDVLVNSQPMYVVGTRAGTGATFPGVFAAFQPTSANSGDTILSLVGLSVTGTHKGVVARTQASSLFQQEFNNQGAGNSEVYIGVEGAGDPRIQFNDLTGRFLVGIDNSDAHKFKISTGSALGSGDRFVIDSSGNVGIGTTTPTLGPLTIGSGAYVSAGGTWTNASDRNLKENFTTLTPVDILQKISQLPLSQWNYKSEGPSVSHIGPVAQDFWEAFHLGNSSSSISTIDPAGVALLGIQALNQKLQALQGSLTRNATTGELTVYNAGNFSGDSVGEAKILTGHTSVRITFTQPYTAQPIVTADVLNQFVQHYIADVDAAGFTIRTPVPVTQDTTFDWHSFASPAEQLFVSDGSTAPIPLILSAASQRAALTVSLSVVTDPIATTTPSDSSASSTSDSVSASSTTQDTLVPATPDSTLKAAAKPPAPNPTSNSSDSTVGGNDSPSSAPVFSPAPAAP